MGKFNYMKQKKIHIRNIFDVVQQQYQMKEQQKKYMYIVPCNSSKKNEKKIALLHFRRLLTAIY